MRSAARLQATIEILGALAQSDMPADRTIRNYFRARRYAGSKDRASVAERVFTIYRHRASFAWRMQSETPRALAVASLLAEGMDADGIAALFSGEGYGPAPLNETERAAIARAPEGEPPLHVKGEFPAFLESELTERFGDSLLAEMQAMTLRAPIDLRVNTLKASREDVLARLRAEGFDASATRYSPFAICVPSGASGLERTAAFASGLFEFQDEAAQIAVLLCGAKPGMRVLDIAAGAGGKALALAAAMRNEGEIVATDISASRLKQIDARARRAGATIIRKNSLSPSGGEGRVRGRQKSENRNRKSEKMLIQRTSDFRLPTSDFRSPPHPNPLPRSAGAREKQIFDLVLLDAPCSGSGMWRRAPEQKWRLTPARLAGLVTIQDELLARAAAQIAPGGQLVYATCSLLPCENERRIAAFLERTPGFGAIPAATIWRARVGDLLPPGMDEFFRASPYVTGTDGFFTAVLAKETL